MLMDDNYHAQRLASIIEIPTISSTQKTNPKPFDDAKAQLKVLFPTLFSKCDVGYLEYGFYLVFKGKSSEDPLLFMNHYDVVDADGKWDTNPFKPEIIDGKLYGRGTLDTKGGLYCMLQAAEELLNEGFIPEHDIYFLSTGNEETAGEDAVQASKIFEEKGLQFRYVLDEGGMILYDPLGFAPSTYAMIGLSEKFCMQYRFVSTSTGGHTAMPPKKTPINEMAKFVCEASNPKLFKRKLSPGIKQMFKIMSKNMCGVRKLIFGHPTLFSFVICNILTNFSDLLNAFVATTVTFTVAKGGEEYNVIPTNVDFAANIRIPPHQDKKEVLDKLEKLAKKYGLKMENIDTIYSESCEASFKNDAFNELSEALKVTYPDAIPTPYVMTAGSDALRFYNVCKSIYHFTPFFIESSQLGGIHGDNEYIAISTLGKAVEFYKKLYRY